MATPDNDVAVEASLAELAQYVASARDVESLSRPMLELMERVTGLESTYLTSIDTAKGVQRVLFSRCSELLTIPEDLTVPWGDTLCKRALTEGKFFVDDVAERWGDSEAARQLGIATYMSQPVVGKDGEIYGTLCAASSLRKSLSPATIDIIALFAKLIGQQIDRESMFDQLVNTNTRLLNRASADPLTGIANRRAFREQLDAMLRTSDEPVQVAFIDLDGFKSINDHYGHDVGDRFLIEMAMRLMKAVRRRDLVARLGGDEFVVATVGSHPKALLQRLEKNTCGRFILGVYTLDYDGPSIGIVSAVESEDVDAVIARADRAMYEIKQQRRQRDKA